jgi:lysophospholipid acyltransferase (LPLAT)-like uncharacterized protein
MGLPENGWDTYQIPLPFSRKFVKKNEVLNSWNVVFPSFSGTKEHAFN